MPRGLLLIEWDVKKGPLLKEVYPKSLKVTDGLLNQIYVAHRTYSVEPGFTRITTREIKVVSFYSGMKDNVVGIPEHVVAMIFRKDESLSGAKDLLEEQSKVILENISSGKYKKMMEETFNKMKVL
ncbi:MAG: hypothetical protein ACTSUE_25770 [Promethearchaeota archaeon]